MKPVTDNRLVGLKEASKRRRARERVPTFDIFAARNDSACEMTFPELGHEPFNLSPDDLSTAWAKVRA